MTRDFFLLRSMGELTADEFRSLKDTDIFKCSGCHTIYRAKKGGCPRSDSRCKGKRQVPTRRTSG